MHRGWDIWSKPTISFRFSHFGSFVLLFWVLVRGTRFYLSLFYTTKSKAVYLVEGKQYNFKAIWTLVRTFEEKENQSFYSSISHEQTTCPRQVKFSRLGRTLKPREKAFNLAGNLYHFKSWILFDIISANPGAKVFMRHYEGKETQHRSSILRPFLKSHSSTLQFHYKKP